MRVRWPSDGRGHVHLFALTLAAGVAAIIALKSIGWPQAVVTAVPAALLVFYAVLVSAVPLFRLRGDRAGDSCYYLGFLYTLTSLSSSLYTFARAPAQIEPLIGDFGIALVTTFVGIALRVIFAQYREDAQDLERQTRIEVGEAARRFRAQLDNAVMEFSSFATAARLTHEELVREMAKQQLALVEQTTEHLAKVAAASADQVKAAVEGVAEVAAVFREEAKKLNQGLRGSVGTMERIARDLDGLDSPAGQIERSVERLVGAIDGAAEGLEARRLADEARMNAVDRTILATGQAADTVREVAIDLRRSVDAKALANALGDFIKGLQQWREQLDAGTVETLALGQALRLVREEDIARLKAALGEQGGRLEGLLAKEQRLVDQVEQRLVAAIDRLIAEVDAGNGAGVRSNSAAAE